MTTTTKPRRARAIRSDDAPVPYDATRTADDAAIADALAILARRCVRDGELITSPQTAGQFAQLQLAQRDTEAFAVMFLDTRHRMLAWEILFTGTIDGCDVHPRVVATRALQLNAAAVILAHNHPSGNPEPSAADRAVTARIKAALALLDIRTLDHFIVTGTNAPTSLAARGWV